MPPKKDFVENKEAMQKAIDNYNQVNEWWTEYYNTEEGQKNKKLLHDKLHFDTREMPFFVAFLHGYTDKATFLKNLKTEVENIKKDRFKALDNFMDKYEGYDFSSIKTDTVENCNKTFLFLRLNQLPGNIVNFDKEYKAHRLNSIEKQMLSDNFVQATTMYLTDNLNSIYREVGNLQEKTEVEDNSYLDVDIIEAEDNKVCSDATLTVDYMNGKSDSYDFPVPDYFYYYEEMQKDKPNLSSDIVEKYASLKDHGYAVVDNCLHMRFNNEDSVSRRNSEPLGENFKYDYFIDGKPLGECVEHIEGEAPHEYKIRSNIYMANAIKEGRAIDLTKMYIENGLARTEIIPLKIKFSDEINAKVTKDLQEAKVKREHSWFRRTFFDWGPFRIKRDPNILENIQKENLAKKDERNKAILEYRNTKFLDLLNEKRKSRYKLDPLKAGDEILSKYNLTKNQNKNYTLEEAKEVFKDYIKSNDKSIDKNIDLVKHELSSLDKSDKTKEIELKGISNLLKNRIIIKEGIIKNFGKIDDRKLIEHFEKLGSTLDSIKNKDDKSVDKLKTDMGYFKDMIKSEYPNMTDEEYNLKSDALMNDVKGAIDNIAKESGNEKAFEFINLIKDRIKDYDPVRLEKALEKLENEPEKLQERIDVLKDNRVQMDLSYIFDEEVVSSSNERVDNSKAIETELEL